MQSRRMLPWPSLCVNKQRVPSPNGSAMRKCVFCMMPQGEVSRMIYADRVCSVLINKLPVERGHLLVVSKRHYKDMLSAPDATISHMFRVARKFGRLEMRKLKCFGMDIGVNIGGVSSVHHFHIHVLPRYSSRLLHFAYPGRNEIRKKEIKELRQLLSI